MENAATILADFEAHSDGGGHQPLSNHSGMGFADVAGTLPALFVGLLSGINPVRA